jgi:Acetyltransferase (GNAT) domain
MGQEVDNEFEIKTTCSVDEVGTEAWDSLSGGRPFQSARWYRYGEQVMAGCRPVYIILSHERRPVARGTFWQVRDEPIPVSAPVRRWLTPILQRWPLLICRSPVSNSSGLILPEPPLREPALRMIAEAAARVLRRSGGSFLVFDYMEGSQTKLPGWPSQFKTLQIADPGTCMAVKWENFEAYLRSNTKFRIHQHFKRSRREAAELGVRVTRQASCDDPAAALELIRNVERKHGSAPNPWVYNMLKNLEMVEGTWLSARVGDRLAGCMLLLSDNGVQIASLPGLADDIPFVYFMLLYEAIQDALERKLKLLRWGSGAYETKRRLGFELEQDNHVIFRGNGLLPQLITRMAIT